jgi:hypothetical protein
MGASIRVFEQVGVPHLQEKAGAGQEGNVPERWEGSIHAPPCVH